MKITYKGDYALKAVLDLALHYNQGLVTLHELSQRIDAPIKFLEQVLLDLKRGGFVESKRGKVGGYSLSRPPEQIKLGQIVRFIDGPIAPIACIEPDYTQCRDVNKCVFRDIWQKISQTTAELIDQISFADLAQQTQQNKGLLTYSI